MLLMPAAMLLFSAGPAPENEEPYRARPENVPEWAQPGNFRFIRVDGGGIESRKAERTWWGEKFSAEEKDVLAHVYDRDFDRMLGLLKQAEFNWIWVTWSNGWSLPEESENRELIKTVIARCHENGIHVTAYLSATNMFWKSAYRDDPETKKLGLWVHGIPLFYAGLTKTGAHISWERRLADVRKPEWRAYLLKKAELAVDAGVDAIFFDNVIGDTEGMRLLLGEVQRMAEAKAAATGRPKAMVYANVHWDPGRFDLNDSGEVIWEEAGKDTPGVWPAGWQIANARKIKFLSGEKLAWQPLIYENDVYHCGPRETCIPAPVEQKLSIAEAYAFGAAYSRNIEGRFLKALIKDEKEAQEAWAAIAQYNHFLVEHRDLYHQVVPVARIALMSKEEKNPLADYFIKQNITFETKVLNHLGKGIPLKDFKVLVIPFPLPKLNDERKIILASFAAAGGVIFCPGSEDLIKMLNLGGKSNIIPISGKTLARIKSGEPAGDLVKQVEAAAGGPVIALENRGYLATNVTKKSDENIFIVHLINYDHDVPAENVKVRLDLSDQVKNLGGFELKVISPDESQSLATGISKTGGVCEFSLSRIQHYVIVVLSPKAAK